MYSSDYDSLQQERLDRWHHTNFYGTNCDRNGPAMPYCAQEAPRSICNVLIVSPVCGIMFDR